VGGLDTVLASVPEELSALRARRTEKARQAFRRGIAARVAEGRRAQHEGYDPLLDVRSASIPELTGLVSAAFARMGEDPPGEGEEIGTSLSTLSRWLEEELEELVVDAGRRVGMDVDTDENVHPFEVAFTFGSGMRIEALPGMEMPAEERTLLGSFWRETAVVREELEWFATGHRLTEALLELARDGEAGRTAFLQSRAAPRSGGLYLRWKLRWPTPADLAPGARVPSRQASRYLDESPLSLLVDMGPAHAVVDGGASRLEESIDRARDAKGAPPPSGAIEAAAAAAEKGARAELSRRVERAVKKLAAHADAEEERLLAAAHEGGSSRQAVERALVSVLLHRELVEEALRKVDLELDAAAVVLPG
jgi:ATP-dependent helicase HepA